MSKKKSNLPFDKVGGVIMINKRLLDSEVFLTMPPAANKLFLLLHSQWRPHKPVGYGVRQAATKIGCAQNTATRAFHTLEERGFIICENESVFHSKSGSRARAWRLTWMPYTWDKYAKPPSNEWEKWESKNKLTVSKCSTQKGLASSVLRH
jgi:hypothetical protein